MSVLVTSADFGFYVVAVAMSSIVGPIYSGLNVVLTPAVIGAQGDQSGALQAARTVVLGAVLGGSAAIGISVVAPWLLPALFDVGFQGAVGMARILLAASIFQGANLVLGTALRGMNRPGAPTIAEGVGALLTVVLLLALPLLPRLGGIGATLASLVSYVVVSAIEALMVATAGSLSLANVTLDWKRIGKALLQNKNRNPI
jgi:O-antigen/teichoic acid export membrane protein